jgi:hypothetical protein
LDVNGAAISSDKLNFDFTSTRVQNFSNYTSFKTQTKSPTKSRVFRPQG